jgi:hypothetical protein
VLENSDLSKKVVNISKTDAMRFLDNRSKSSQIEIQAMQQRLAWGQKSDVEKQHIENLFDPDVANFIIRDYGVRFTFDRKADLKGNEIEITKSQLFYVEDGQNYVQAAQYQTDVINNKKAVVHQPETGKALIKTIEARLPPTHTKKKVPINNARGKPAPEPERLMISLGKEITKHSPALKKLQDDLKDTYKSDIEKMLMQQKFAESAPSSGSSFNATMGSGIKGSTVRNRLAGRR